MFDYLKRLFFPSLLYAFSTKIRLPKTAIEYRKFLTIRYLLKKGGSAIDGGAHIGYYTRMMSETLREKGTVWSFEPNPYVFTLLKKYAKHQKNIRSFPYALSQSSENNVSFYVNPYSISQNSTLEKRERGQEHIRVSTLKIDELISLGLKDLKVIKLDVEGHELEVLKGAQTVLARFCPWIIFEYFNDDTRSDVAVIDFLQNAGYVCIDLETLKPLNPDTKTGCTDGLAIPLHQKDEGLSFADSLSYHE